MAKPKSKISKLPAHIREALDGWLLEENLTYEECREKLHLDFNIQTSARALSEYFTVELFEPRNAKSAEFADRVAAAAAADPAKYDEATIATIRRRAFNVSIAEDGSVQDLAILAGILGDSAKLKLKERDIGLQERRVAILEERHAVVKQQLEAALGKARSKGAFTAELLKSIEEAVGMLG